jgi:hypothetical protein
VDPATVSPAIALRGAWCLRKAARKPAFTASAAGPYAADSSGSNSAITSLAACGAIIHRKLVAEGTNRTIPLDWFASGKTGR